MNKRFSLSVIGVLLYVLTIAQTDTTTRNSGIPNFGRTIMLADSIAKKAIADSAFITLANAQNVTGVKSFVPFVTATSGIGRGLVINPTFTAGVSGDVLSSLYIAAPNVTNLSSFPSLGVYSAIFAGNVKVSTLAGNIRTNNIIRDNSLAPMTILKPGSNVSHLLVFDGRQDTTQSTNLMISANLFRDSLAFKSNTTAEGYTQFLLQPVIKQTGYTGTTRGIYVNAALTGTTDFRAVQTNVASGNGYQFYASGTAPSCFAGNMGIGVSSPTEKLHVNGNILTTAKFYVGSLYRTIGDVLQSDSLSHVMTFRNTTGVGNPKGGFDFGDIANVSWMRLVAGKVGIGTTQPQSELAVNGVITAKRVKVTTQGWADFVFDSSYQLQPLSQVATFIQQNKHLPDVPSASEVAQQGVDLGQSQATLLRKLEELTLYIIEQNKQLEMQKREAEIQKDNNCQLMMRLVEIEKQLAALRLK